MSLFQRLCPASFPPVSFPAQRFYSHILFFFLIYFYFWLSWVFVAVCGLSLVVASRSYSSLWCVGFSLQWPLLSWSTGSRHAGFSSCGSRAQYLWHTGLVAPQHVGFSQTRVRTRVPCIGRQILNHCGTREALLPYSYGKQKGDGLSSVAASRLSKGINPPCQGVKISGCLIYGPKGQGSSLF